MRANYPYYIPFPPQESKRTEKAAPRHDSPHSLTRKGAKGADLRRGIGSMLLWERGQRERIDGGVSEVVSVSSSSTSPRISEQIKALQEKAGILQKRHV